MAESEVTYEVSCELCGWKTAGSIRTDDADVFAEVLGAARQCSEQHAARGASGLLLVVWEPLGTTRK